MGRFAPIIWTFGISRRFRRQLLETAASLQYTGMPPFEGCQAVKQVFQTKKVSEPPKNAPLPLPPTRKKLEMALLSNRSCLCPSFL